MQGDRTAFKDNPTMEGVANFKGMLDMQRNNGIKKQNVNKLLFAGTGGFA